MSWDKLKIFIEVMPIKNSFIIKSIKPKPFEPRNNIEIGDETWSQIIAYQWTNRNT